MAGLLDSIFQPGGGGYGGILDFLRNSSPLYKKEEVLQPQYDALGNALGPSSTPIDVKDPFGPIPNLQQWAKQFAPQSQSPFNIGASALPGMAPGMLQPYQQQPQPMPSPQAVAAQQPVAAPPMNNSTDVSSQNRPQFAPQQPYVPSQGELPPALGGRATGFFDSINNGLQSIGNGGSIIGALTGNRTDPQSSAQQNLNAQFQVLTQTLMQSGMPQREARSKAMLAVLNPKAGESIFAQAFGNKEPPKSVEEFAVRNAWENRGQPQGAASAGLPTTLEGLQKYQTDQAAEKERATTLAKKQAELAVTLPDTLLRAEQTIKNIDEVKNHPAKSYRTGVASALPAIPGFGGADFDERVKQLKGGAFLDAYKMLRGTGAISEAEGAKAEQAQARLSQAKSEKDFNQALDDMREVVVKGYANAQKQAGQETIQQYQMPVGQSRNIGGIAIKRVK